MTFLARPVDSSAMIRVPALLLLLLLVVTAPAAATPAMEAALRAHIAVLASDDYEGRQPGTAGEAKAIAYIAEAFARAGLKPGAPGGGWYQRVTLSERKPLVAHMALRTTRGGTRRIKAQLAVTGRAAHVRLEDAPLIYAGFARTEDLVGADLTGAVVLYRTELPDKAIRPTTSERREALRARGAAAVIAVSDRTSWAVVTAFIALGATSLIDPATAPDLALRGAASPVTARALLRAAGGDPDLYADAARPGFHAIVLPATVDLDATSAVRTYASHNVIGMVPGRAAGGEAVAFTAHWDHLGLCRPPGAADRICNGAVDNASGVAVLIETARALAADPPPRDTLFVATTAEEGGLLGAEAFATVSPRDRIVAALNIDTIAVARAGEPVAILGRGTTPALDAVIDDAARGLGRHVSDSLWANALLERQDGWALAQRGVPSVMVGGGLGDRAALESFLAGIYHSPADDLAHLPPLDGAAEDVALHVALGRALGDPARYPAQR